jgi:putative endonuclease
MYFVYVLRSISYNSTYVGYTSNLNKRLVTHNAGKVRSTKSKTPYELIYYEAYINKELAISREKHLKNSRFEKTKLFQRIFEATI